MFITFEGIDGSGKTTQLQMLAQTLSAQLDVEIVTTREPGGSAVGQLIRNILLGDTGRHVEIDPYTQVLLFAADRVAHMEQVIKPALKRRAWVLCDRWEDTTKAYQGAGNQLADNPQDAHFVQTITHLARRNVEPSATFLFDVTAEVSAQRVSNRGATLDRFEQQDIDFRNRVRQAYLELYRADQTNAPRRIHYFDAETTVDDLHQQVVSAVYEHLLVPQKG